MSLPGVIFGRSEALEADFNGELFVLSVFESLSAQLGTDDTFTNANII